MFQILDIYDFVYNFFYINIFVNGKTVNRKKKYYDDGNIIRKLINKENTASKNSSFDYTQLASIDLLCSQCMSIKIN